MSQAIEASQRIAELEAQRAALWKQLAAPGLNMREQLAMRRNVDSISAEIVKRLPPVPPHAAASPPPAAARPPPAPSERRLLPQLASEIRESMRDRKERAVKFVRNIPGYKPCVFVAWGFGHAGSCVGWMNSSWTAFRDYHRAREPNPQVALHAWRRPALVSAVWFVVWVKLLSLVGSLV